MSHNGKAICLAVAIAITSCKSNPQQATEQPPATVLSHTTPTPAYSFEGGVRVCAYDNPETAIPTILEDLGLSVVQYQQNVELDSGASLIETYGTDTVEIGEDAFRGIVTFMHTFDPATDLANCSSFAGYDLDNYLETRKLIGNKSIVIMHDSPEYDRACNPLSTSATFNPLMGSPNTTSLSLIRLHDIMVNGERDNVRLAQHLGTEIAQQSSRNAMSYGPEAVLEEALHNGIGQAAAIIEGYNEGLVSYEEAYNTYVRLVGGNTFQLYYMTEPIEFGLLGYEAFYRLMDGMGGPLILEWSGE